MPKAISRKLDPAKQAAFIKAYEALLNQLAADEAMVFADAAHPTHPVRLGRLLGAEGDRGRDHAEQRAGPANIHGAIDLETA